MLGVTTPDLPYSTSHVIYCTGGGGEVSGVKGGGERWEVSGVRRGKGEKTFIILSRQKRQIRRANIRRTKKV